MKHLLIALALLALLPACHSTPNSASSASLSDPAARAFQGVIISLRPQTNTMLVSKKDDVYQLNMVYVKWDRQTKFWLDGQPADLTQIQRYMLVDVHGRMRDGQFVGEELRFSSQLAPNAPQARD